MEKSFRLTKDGQAADSLPIQDFCTAMGFPFVEQLGQNRYFRLVMFSEDGLAMPRNFTVDIKLNQWLSQDGHHGGKLTDLLHYLHVCLPDEMGRYDKCMRKVFELYKEYMGKKYLFTFSNVRIGRASSTLKSLGSDEVMQILAKNGLSLMTAARFCKELHVEGTDGHGDLLAFPCDNGRWYGFNGMSFRPLTEKGISTFGNIDGGRYCYVFENPMDFLSLMEIWHRNRVEAIFGGCFHLVINGKGNIDEAVDVIKRCRASRSVRCILPRGKDGGWIFKEVLAATMGTARDCHHLFYGFPSLAASIRPRPTGNYKDSIVKDCGLKDCLSQPLLKVHGKNDSQIAGRVVARLLGKERTMEIGLWKPKFMSSAICRDYLPSGKSTFGNAIGMVVRKMCF